MLPATAYLRHPVLAMYAYHVCLSIVSPQAGDAVCAGKKKEAVPGLLRPYKLTDSQRVF